jgi:hypothetical protein
VDLCLSRELQEVPGVHGHQHFVTLQSDLEQLAIGPTRQPDVRDRPGRQTQGIEPLGERWRDVLIEKQLHRVPTVTTRETTASRLGSPATLSRA